jgi:hypothetical protein
VKKTFILFLILVNCTYAGGEKPLKILHITMHRGCLEELEGVAKALSLDLTSWYIRDLPPKFLDGTTEGAGIYNIGHKRAEKIWNLHQEFFHTFDAIITSDTAPFSRIFLQNHWEKPLIIWICNRFDYFDEASLDCDFPDQEYYDLFRKATRQSNITIVAYTQFEHLYAKSKGVDTGSLTITPTGLFTKERISPSVPSNILKEDLFFLPPYHNETIFMNLSNHCNNLKIPNYCGYYNGSIDLSNFKGIIHIPYAWSNLAFFENIHLGIPYFVPSVKFMKKLMSRHNFHFQDRSFFLSGSQYQLAEWYSPDHAPVFTYFDSWHDLQNKINNADYPALREKIRAHAQRYGEKMLGKWREVFDFSIRFNL